MSTYRNVGFNLQEKIPNKLKEPKNMIHISEAIIMGDKYKQKSRLLPTVTDTIQILNKKIVRPSTPTVTETVLLNKQCKSYKIQ